MAFDKRIEALLQSRHVEYTHQTYDVGDSEQRQVREQLVKYPKMFLRNGCRQHSFPWYGYKSMRLHVLCCPLSSLNDSRNPSHSRNLKEIQEGHLNVHSVTHARHNLHGQERVPSQLKKIVVDANTFEAQQVAPDSRNLLFNRSARRYVVIFK